VAAGALAGLPFAASAAPPWSAPVNLSTPGSQLPSEPSVAVAPNGRAIIAWWRRDATLAPARDVVQISRRARFAAPFLGPVTLSAQADNFAAQPDAAAVSGGPALVGWTQATNAVALKVLPPTGAAVPLTTLTEGAQVDLVGVDVGLAPAGGAVAVWTRDPLPAGPAGGDATVRVSTRSPLTGAWSAPADLSAPGGGHPAVAVAPDGSSVVAWERAGAIEAAVRTATGPFGAPITLSTPDAGARLPAVAVDSGGDAVVAWLQDAVMVAERTASGPFGAPRAISATGGMPDVPNLGAPVLAMSTGGRAIAAWRRQDGGHLRVEAAVRPAGLDWRAPAALSPAATRNAGRPALGIGARGHAVVAWSQPVGTSLSAIRARPLTRAGTRFGALESVSAKSGRGTAPSVGLDSRGRSVLAWREDPAGGPGRFFRAVVRLSPG
jgi:hypothetical protein